MASHWQGSNDEKSRYWQNKLIDHCRTAHMREPVWNLMSDRRGGRTAWSSIVIVEGQHIAARFWYDGTFMHNAREDAAEVALQRLGVVPTPHKPQGFYGALTV